MIDRRTFLLRSGAVLGGLAVGGCTRKPGARSQATLLEDIVRDSVVPGLEALPAPSLALVRATSALHDCSVERLGLAQEAFRSCALAWARVYAFRAGPAVESNALLRATFWPPRPSSIQRVLDSKDPLTPALVDSLGVDAKGLYALEHLLFGAGKEAFAGPESVRRAELVHALALDVSERASAVQQRLRADGDFARSFASAGQESVSKLVNQMVETVETVTVDRMERVLGLEQHGRLTMTQMHAGPSGLSSAIPRAWVDATWHMYGSSERGLYVLVERSNRAAAARVSQAFEGALTALDALGGPLERIVVQNRERVQRAARALKELELALKVDLSAALAVTLSIAAGDGD